MNYQILNRINRALDTFLQPQCYGHIDCLQGLRVLYEYRQQRNTYRLMPSETELHERFHNLSIPIITENKSQIVHELMDTAIYLGIDTQDLLRQLENNREAFTRMNRLLGREYNTHLSKREHDIFNLKNITQDKQNVHNTLINDNFKNALIKLCNEYPSQFPNREWEEYTRILKSRNSWNSDKNDRSLKFIKTNSSSFGIGITLKQMFLSLCMFIWKHQHYKEELLDRLNQELTDMSGTCSTGHMSRLINVLQGYSEEYSIILDPKKYMRTKIYSDLNEKLSKSSEEIQEGILGKSPQYIEFVMSQKDKFVSLFGTPHSKFIENVCREFIDA